FSISTHEHRGRDFWTGTVGYGRPRSRSGDKKRFRRKKSPATCAIQCELGKLVPFTATISIFVPSQFSIMSQQIPPASPICETQPKKFPLPEGEGWGEGEESIRPTSTRKFILAIDERLTKTVAVPHRGSQTLCLFG